MKLAFVKQLSNESIMLGYKPGSLLDLHGGSFKHLGLTPDSMGDKLGEMLINMLTTYKNKIIPLKQSIVNSVTAGLTMTNDSEKYLGLEIVDVNPMLGSFLKTLQEDHLPERPNIDFNNYNFIGDNIFYIDTDALDEESLNNLFLLDNTKTDSIISASLIRTTIEQRKDLVKRLQIISGNPGRRRDLMDMFMSISTFFKNLDLCILLVSFLVKAYKVRPTTNMEEGSDKIVSTLASMFLYKFEQSMELYTDYMTRNIVCFEVSDEVVYVFKETYSMYLDRNQEDGNAVDALLGLYPYCKDNKINPITLDLVNIMSMKEDLANACTRYIQANTILYQDRRVAKVKTYYNDSFIDAIDSLTEEDIENIFSNVSNLSDVDNDTVENQKETLKRSVIDYLNNSTDSELLEVDECVTKILGTVVFKDKYFIAFADKLRKVTKTYGNISIQQAAYIACVSLLVDILKQDVEVRR